MRTRKKKHKKNIYINKQNTSPTFVYQYNDNNKNTNIIMNDIKLEQ